MVRSYTSFSKRCMISKYWIEVNFLSLSSPPPPRKMEREVVTTFIAMALPPGLALGTWDFFCCCFGGVKQQEFILYTSWGQKSQIKMSAKLVPFGCSKRESVPCLSPSCCWQAWCCLGYGCISSSSPSSSHGDFPSTHFCVSESLLRRAPFFGFGAHFNLVWPHPNITLT